MQMFIRVDEHAWGWGNLAGGPAPEVLIPDVHVYIGLLKQVLASYMHALLLYVNFKAHSSTLLCLKQEQGKHSNNVLTPVHCMLELGSHLLPCVMYTQIFGQRWIEGQRILC